MAFFLGVATLFSQSIEEFPLLTNKGLTSIRSYKKSKTEQKSLSVYDTVNLDAIKGIVDDFSYEGPYPDTSLWIDNLVFINRGYGKAPITIGVATFDGLDAGGYPYNFAVNLSSSTSSDTLTSKPINLEYLQADSLYLSFYYQPQGIGNAPEFSDSLVLEFKGPDSSLTWQQVWFRNGRSLAAEDSSWNLVMLPIIDTAFLKKGFQFRFRNRATINGNLDHWHIDYIYLNKGRSFSDTIFSDISWVYDGTSLLNTYRSIPWKQFDASDLNSTLLNLIRNNYTSTQNVNYEYVITDDSLQTTLATFSGSVNILPFDSNNVYTDCDVSIGCISSVANAVGSFPSSLTSSTQFTVKHFYANTVGDMLFVNDTLTVSHQLTNYFAYDDGTAENAVGLNRYNAQLAEQYTLKVGDTLQAIDIYFNPIETNATLYSFSLHVWNDNGGEPGAKVYTSESVLTPSYEQMGQNKFTRYMLEPPLYISPSTFYIGFTQNTDQFLNVGEDKNNNTENKTFYSYGDGWLNSTLGGSVMMHPVLGVRSEIVGTEDIIASRENKIEVYPNPVSDQLMVDNNSYFLKDDIFSYRVIDLLGKIVLTGNWAASETIDVSSLSVGIYILSISNDVDMYTAKFIKID